MEAHQAAAREKVVQWKEVATKETVNKEVVAKAAADKKQATHETMIDVEEFDSHHTQDQEVPDVEGGGGVEQGTPFVVKKRPKQTTSGPRKKQKSTRFSQVNPLVLT